MQTNGLAGLSRAMMLCAGAAGLALAAGAANAQASYPDYPPPAPARQAYPPAPGDDYPVPPPGYAQGRAAASVDPRYADPRYADPRYADPRYAEPRYPDPRYADARPSAPQYRDPRYADPDYDSYQPAPMDPRAQAEDERAYRRWADRYYGRGRPAYPGQVYPAQAYPAQAYAQPYPPQPYAAGPAGVANAPVAAPTAPAPVAAPSVEGPAAPPAEPAKVVAAAEQIVPAPHLPHRLTEAAQAYADYMKKTSAIDAAFKSGASVAEAVKTGAAYEAHQFEEGAIAYAALTALQEPEFVAGVRELQREGARADFAEQLVAYPQAALNIHGADAAAARAAGALHRHGEKLVSTGAQVKQAAYDVQHSAWSKAEVANPDARLAAAKSISAARWELKGEEAPELLKLVTAEAAGDGGAVPSPVVQRGLAIAALAVLGQLQGVGDTRLAALLEEPRSASCLKMAKLNLFQCLSVSRPHYEDIFCLGEHAMMETGQCVVKAAGYTPVPVTLARAGGVARK
jgi:hypothetical protein